MRKTHANCDRNGSFEKIDTDKSNTNLYYFCTIFYYCRKLIAPVKDLLVFVYTHNNKTL